MAVTYDRGAQLAKFNVFMAYWVFPVNPVDRHLFGICWKEHVDTMLLFLRSVPKVLYSASTCGKMETNVFRKKICGPLPG